MADGDGWDLEPEFARPEEAAVADPSRLPAREMAPASAYQLVHDEVMLDGNARLNLATFVGTWMDPHAARLYAETVDKNIVDKDEYPKTAAIEERCWRILAGLWNAPDPAAAVGTSTVGSSEACMLAGLALKRRWQDARRAAGLPADRPNLVMSSAVQVVWERFCTFWDVEARYVPLTEEHPVLDGTDLASYVDEGTIGVVAIMGVTYTGRYEPVDRICAALDAVQAATGLDVPVHVDGASGAMVAPFLQPDTVWDFRLDRVASVSTSGHKYGLVYPGVGWVVWRDAARLPDALVLSVSYLGGSMPTIGLNFSRPGAQVLLQYYTFLRLGHDGFRKVQGACRDVARHLADGVAALPAFELVGDGSDIPVLAWRQTPGHTDNWTLYHLQDRLRARGWLVPAYPMPDDLADTTVQRIVVRNGLGMELAEDLLADVRAETAFLDRLSGPMPAEGTGPAFHH